MSPHKVAFVSIVFVLFSYSVRLFVYVVVVVVFGWRKMSISNVLVHIFQLRFGTATNAYFTHTNKPNTYTVHYENKNSARKKRVKPRNTPSKLKFCHFHSISFGLLSHSIYGNQWHFFILLFHWLPCINSVVLHIHLQLLRSLYQIGVWLQFSRCFCFLSSVRICCWMIENYFLFLCKQVSL